MRYPGWRGILLVMAAMVVPMAGRAAPPTAEVAEAFVVRAEKELAAHSVLANRADWVHQTHLSDDTEALAAEFGARGTALRVRLAKEAARFDGVQELPFDVRRKLGFLKQGIVLPAPERPGAAEELSALATRLQSRYGKGQGTLDGRALPGSDVEEAMRVTRNPDQLRELWSSWHDGVGAPMREDYARLVAIANAGAQELGFADVGAMWRSGYDMTADAFAREMDRLWLQVKPLYDQLHCYVRARLHERYGARVQPATGPIRADLLGNLWGQEWGNVYDLVAPPGAGELGYDVTELLTERGYDPVRMVKTAEGFYTSLGLPALPASFWERSQFVKPRDREVLCHASAWDIDDREDLRIKMCIKVNADDFVTVHHELGHNYYQRAYLRQPYLYLNGAHDGFHEAIGDFIALSITPEYLVGIGLLAPGKVPSPDKDIGLLLRQALDKVAFLPFALMMDRWRWGVFGGETGPEAYQSSWTSLRLRYQGIVPPVERPATAFDPGAKYHIPANVPYARYFLAAILQFQFYQAAAEQVGWKGPLHRCSFHGDRGVGERLDRMLAMGASRPWPEALEAFTGRRTMDGSAILAYFQPLQKWLEEQNRGRACGW